jgi:hypothetical protein
VPAERAPRPPLLSSSSSLSSAQIRPRVSKVLENPSIRVAIGGRHSAVRVPGEAQKGGGKREAIVKFTSKARKNLLDWLNQIDRRRVSADQVAFGTLTYPEEFPCAAVSKRHFSAFLKRLDRRFPGRPLIWKIEPQPGRGAPHFHFLLIEDKPISSDHLAELVDWVARNWVDVVDAGDSFHLPFHLGQLGNGNKPCVELVRSWEGVISYAGKYLAKLTPQTFEHFDRPGRFWGIVNREAFPRTIVTTELTMPQALLLKRTLRRYKESQPSDWYYVPGAPRVSGKHSPGERIHGATLFQMKASEQPVPFRQIIDRLSAQIGRQIRPQFRRVTRGSGGISCYIASETGVRLLEWVQRLRPGVPEPSAPF